MFNNDNGDLDDLVQLTADPPTAALNEGALERWNRTRFSKPFETFGRLHTPLFSQCKLLPTNSKLQIKLIRADSEFCLMSEIPGHKYNLVIDKAYLWVCHKQIAPSVRLAHELAFKDNKAKYLLRRAKCKFFTKGAGLGDLSEQNLVVGSILPRKIIIGLLEADNFNGQLARNPFNFKHFGLNEIVLRVNGETIPYETLQPDFANNCHLEAYISLLQGTSRLLQEESGLSIDPFVDYPHGYCLYGFDLTPDLSETPSFHLLKEGKISLNIKLSQAHSISITIVAYMEYDSVLEIDGKRQITYETSI
jgi:hypothetical protein